jgi:predicted ester cyclase
LPFRGIGGRLVSGPDQVAVSFRFGAQTGQSALHPSGRKLTVCVTVFVDFPQLRDFLRARQFYLV